MSVPAPLFDALPVAIQERLIGYIGGNRDASSLSPHDYLAYLRKDGAAMNCACQAADKEAVMALLEAGAPVNLDPSAPESYSPLGLAVNAYTRQTTPARRTESLQIIDALLAQGANPNTPIWGTSSTGETTMHAGVASPKILSRLLRHGGDVAITSIRGIERLGLLDHWLARAEETEASGIPNLIKCFDMLADAGLDINIPVRTIGSFLRQCWVHSTLAPHIGHLIRKGVDPFREESGGARVNFVQFLEQCASNPSHARRKEAESLLADIRAHSLSQATHPSPAMHRPPRL